MNRIQIPYHTESDSEQIYSLILQSICFIINYAIHLMTLMNRFIVYSGLFYNNLHKFSHQTFYSLSLSQATIMGNQCDQCQAVTEGCKRQQFRTELKNRQKLDISRAQAHEKSRSKLQPLLELRKQLPVDNYPNDPDSARNQQVQESLEIINKRKPLNQKQSHNNNDKDITPTFKQSLKLKGSLKDKKSQLDAMFQGIKPIPYKQQESHEDFNIIKLPIESGIQGTNMKRLQELERALMMSRQPPKIGKNNFNSKKTQQPYPINRNSIVNISNPIEESMLSKQSDKENSLAKKGSMRNQPNLNKFSNKRDVTEIQKPVAMKKTISMDRPESSKSKKPQSNFLPDSIVLESQNPSKVLRQFNSSLQQSPIHPIKHQPKSPINYEQSQIPYDEQSITEPIAAVEQHVFYVKPGVYFEGYLSTVTKKVENQGSFRFQSNQTEMLAYFRNGQLNMKKNVMLGFQDGGVFDGSVRKDSEKSEFMACGQGKFIMPDQSYYHGQWLKNLPHGKGLHKFPDGSYYEGEFIQGRKQGQGKFTTAEGDLIYNGSFLNNRIQGLGLMYIIEPNTGKKRIYKGYFKNGKLQGEKCQVEYVEQKAKYIGGFKDGKKCGKGTYYYGDGRVWEGQWQDNRQNGYGKLRNQKGVQVEGYWIDGIKSEGRMSKR